MTADSGPLHPQEQPGRTISLDVSSECYLLFEDKRFVVQAFRLFHRIPSFGFCVQEQDRPGRLKTELLKELGECAVFNSEPIEVAYVFLSKHVLLTISPCFQG